MNGNMWGLKIHLVPTIFSLIFLHLISRYYQNSLFWKYRNTAVCSFTGIDFKQTADRIIKCLPSQCVPVHTLGIMYFLDSWQAKFERSSKSALISKYWVYLLVTGFKIHWHRFLNQSKNVSKTPILYFIKS